MDNPTHRFGRGAKAIGDDLAEACGGTISAGAAAEVPTRRQLRLRATRPKRRAIADARGEMGAVVPLAQLAVGQAVASRRFASAAGSGSRRGSVAQIG